MRRLIDPPLRRAGARLAAIGLRANHLTVFGLAVGLAAIPLLACEAYLPALAVILVNRLLDGLDGAVARQGSASDFGGFLDIVCDMLFYAGVVVGFGLARPDNLTWALVLVASFIGTASSFLAWAILAMKHGLPSGDRGEKAFHYSAGLVEGTETVMFFVIMCLLPEYFPPIAAAFAVLCGLTVLGRVALAWRFFGKAGAPQ